MEWDRVILGRCVAWLILSTTAIGVASAQTDKAKGDLHYKAARIALANNDLKSAEAELREAQKFDPSNPLVLFNLAVVQVNISPQDAMDNLNKAEALGLTASEKQQADELKPKIVYALGKLRRDLVGTWELSYEKQDNFGSVELHRELKLELVGDSVTGRLSTKYDESLPEGRVLTSCYGPDGRKRVDRKTQSDTMVSSVTVLLTTPEENHCEGDKSSTDVSSKGWKSRTSEHRHIHVYDPVPNRE